MREKRKGNAFEAKPKKVGYFQYRRLEKQFYAPYAGQLSVPLDKVMEFRSKYRPWGLVYGIRWLLFVLPHRIDNRLWAYRVRHFPLGKQKWRGGKLYIEKIPYYIGSEATEYLTAILRDYLRRYADDAFSIGSVLYEREGEEGEMPVPIRVTNSLPDENGENVDLERWKQMVRDVADKFDEAADLWREGWEEGLSERGDECFRLHRAKIQEAFSELAKIFRDLND